MQINGRLPLAGLSNNNPAALADLSIVFTTGDGTALMAATGQLVPLSGSIAHSADQKTIKDNRGNEVTVIHSNDKATVEFVCVPLGVIAGGHNALSDVEKAAYIPPSGAWVTVSNAPVINVGPWADGINSVDWMYNCDGRIEFASEGEWGIRFSATRRLYVPRSLAVSI